MGWPDRVATGIQIALGLRTYPNPFAAPLFSLDAQNLTVERKIFALEGRCCVARYAVIAEHVGKRQSQLSDKVSATPLARAETPNLIGGWSAMTASKIISGD